MTHPTELLAEYVDGALGPEERADVQAHLQTCAVCRAEVADAAEARTALRMLPEVEEPPDITFAVRRQARERGAGSRWGAPLRVAAAVVLIAGLAGGGIYVLSQLGSDGGDAGPALDAGGPEGGEGAGAPEAPDEDRAVSEAATSPYPRVRRTMTDHDAASIQRLASDLRDEAQGAVDAGLPRDAFAFYEAFPVDSFPPIARRALVCAGQGLQPDRSVVPFEIQDARWEGEPAWVVSYLLGPEPTEPYDRVQILVVGRQDCRILLFAEQRL